LSRQSKIATRIRFHIPALPDIDAYLADVRQIVDSGWLSDGRFVRQLERRISEWTGGTRVVAASNASDGLIAALSLIGVRGREVIIPGYTFLATWQAVEWAGGIAVVADVNERGLLDPDAVEAAITPSTAAILPVHIAGSLAAMESLRAIADSHGLALVADAAHALGASSVSSMAGAVGDIEVFSIGATKQIAAGEGGLMAVRTEAFEQAARLWVHQGREPGAMNSTGPGMNLRLTELSAALAIRLLERYGDQLRRRETIHARYAEAWSDLPLRLSGPLPGERSAHKDQLVWLDDPRDRHGLRSFLHRAGIETKSYYEVAVPDLTMFKGRISSAERSRSLADTSFAVPIHARLTDAEIERIADAVRGFFGQR
jgi:dTDP-4-amino-4,6-dideoxygalactose transaminase